MKFCNIIDNFRICSTAGYSQLTVDSVENYYQFITTRLRLQFSSRQRRAVYVYCGVITAVWRSAVTNVTIVFQTMATSVLSR